MLTLFPYTEFPTRDYVSQTGGRNHQPRSAIWMCPNLSSDRGLIRSMLASDDHPLQIRYGSVTD